MVAKEGEGKANTKAAKLGVLAEFVQGVSGDNVADVFYLLDYFGLTLNYYQISGPQASPL